MACPIWRRLLAHAIVFADSRALDSVGINNDIRIAIMPITTSNSINVNARRILLMVPRLRLAVESLVMQNFHHTVVCGKADSEQSSSFSAMSRLLPFSNLFFDGPGHRTIML
jgi:hypothetical protein